MHLGNVFAALLAWLSVRARGGRMLLRIEDLDPDRCKPEYATTLMDDLCWLGLDWDAGPRPGDAPSDKWFQSRRTPFYQQQLDKLAALGLVYPCFCTRAQLHAASAPHQSDGAPRYDGRCRALTPEQAATQSRTRAPALRARVPDETLCFTDGLQGPRCENLEREAGDFILRRSDGVFAYQLAAPADDSAMGVTEVVRGQDLLASTARQIWLLRTLGYPPPHYVHTPLLLAPDGRRLAKRERDLDLGALRAKLPSPQPLIGALAHLAGLQSAPRPVTAQALVPVFSWQRIVKSNMVLPNNFLGNYL